MTKKAKKTIIILALVSIVLCACPGCLLMIVGGDFFVKAVGDVQTVGDILNNLGYGLGMGGWVIFPGLLMAFVPLVLGIIALTKKVKEPALEPLTPTGKSQDEPLPPPS